MTSNLADFSPGRASYGLILVKVGRILADAWLVPAADRLLLGVPRDRVALLSEHFEKYLMMEDASHADVSGEFAWIKIRGPRPPSSCATFRRIMGPLAELPTRRGRGEGSWLLREKRSTISWPSS